VCRVILCGVTRGVLPGEVGWFLRAGRGGAGGAVFWLGGSGGRLVVGDSRMGRWCFGLCFVGSVVLVSCEGLRLWVFVVLAGVLWAGCSGGDVENGSGDLSGVERSLVGREELGRVQAWAYQLQGLDGEGYARLAGLEADLLVVDGFDPDSAAAGVDVAGQVARLQEKGGPGLDRRIVLSYLNVGQAEDYRDYWQQGWRVGVPSWIVAADPDGWDGNYQVIFWREEWRRLVRGMVREAVRLGFDGVYLDWIEVYEDEQVVAFAAAEGKNPLREMLRLIGDMREWGNEALREIRVAGGSGESRGKKQQGAGEFLLVAQNAADLAEQGEQYFRLIDGIAQEQVFFDGAAGDDGPEGDCPLPATQKDVGSSGYVDSLSVGCGDLADLDISSEWYLERLTAFREAGVKVFTVDYALVPENISRVFSRAEAEGFVPYAAPRPLDRIGTVFGR